MKLLSRQNILLSISILISERPDTVERCLESLNSLRRKVPSELILVDTGCGEQMRKVIASYADEIVEFEWCNDFARARNAGLKRAKGEWFLYLDDDEWFEDTKEIEDFFLSGKHIYYNYGSYLQRNYSDPEGKNYRDAFVGRLIRLTSDTEFVYSVHEVFSEVKEPWIRLHSYVHHYGYAFKDEEEARKHSRRNIELLLEEHEKDPGELRHIAQLVQEYNSLKEWGKSIEISQKGIQNAGTGRTTEQFLGGLYVNIVRNYVVLGQYARAVEVGEKYLFLANSDELNRAAICYHLCIAYLEKSEYRRSLEAVRQYCNFYEKWKEDRDIFAFYESLAAPFLNEGCWQDALCVAVQDEIQLGNAVMAKKYFDEIDWNAKGTLAEHRVRSVIRLLVRAWLCTDVGVAQEYTAMMKTFLKDAMLAGMVETEIDSLWKNSPELLQTKEADWAALADESWLFLYFKLKNRTGTNKDALLKEYCKFWEEPTNVLMRAGQLRLWEMLQRDNVDVGQIIAGIPFYRWEQAAKKAVEELDWHEVKRIQEYLQVELDADSIHMLCWGISYRMRKIQDMAAEECGEREENSGKQENIVKELVLYAAENEKLCRRLYKDELFRQMPELLPRECQASLKLLGMSEAVDKGNLQKALSMVREALEIMPELSEALKCCAKWISEKSAAQNAEQEKTRNEMRKLAEAVKVQVRNMIAQGMRSEAAGVICQLKAMLPDDEEVIQLEKEIQQR